MSLNVDEEIGINNTNKRKSNNEYKMIDYLFEKFSRSLRIIGPIFSLSIFCFMLLVFKTTIEVVHPYYIKKYNSNYITIIFLLHFVTLLYLIINFILATLVSPGCVKDFRNEVNQSSNLIYLKNAYMKSYISEKSDSKNFKKLNNYAIDTSSTINFPKLKVSDLNYCKSCNKYKPLRSHHCSICKTCVLKMDHHCVWINNCVGLKNHKYFILFLTYLLLESIFFSTLSYFVFQDDIYLNIFVDSKYKELYICLIISSLGIILSVGLVFISWYNLLNGKTTVEFFKSFDIKKSDDIQCIENIDFKLEKWKDNFYVVFGTKSILKAFLLPFTKFTSLHLTGLEYTEIFIENFKSNMMNS